MPPEIQHKERDPATGLRDLIVSGAFQPNQRLLELELVERLGINRAKVRTALAVLEQEGLVISEPHRGARVRLISAAEAIEITEARSALEPLMARQAAEKATKADCMALREILTSRRARIESGVLVQDLTKSGRLHAAIYAIAGNSTVHALLQTLAARIVRFQFRAILIPGRAKASMKEHERIVAAICARNPEKAEMAMRDHMQHVLGALRDAVKASSADVLD